MSQDGQGQGIGTALLKALITASEAEGFWTLEAEIIAGNQASLALHRKCAFREVGYRERLGQCQGIWHDVILLERRSQVVGGPNLPTKTCQG